MKLRSVLIISFLFLSINLFATDHIVITSNYTNTQEYFSYYNNSSSAGGVFDVENKGSLSSSCWVSFYNNTARSGGAILVNSGGRLSLLNGSRFQNNISLSVGGAIYACANTQLYNCNFVNNRAEVGGAIYGESNLSINGCAYFSSNKAIDSGVIYYGACGGAIFIQAGEIVINPNDPVSEFVLNSSKYGGAIYNNSGTLSILDGINFSQNSSSDKGGAIYNKKIVNLMARTRNIQFTGNTANGVSNAIHDNKGTINLWASDNASIIFNDRITSEDTTSILNINSSTTTITATGKIILNEDMSGYIGKVNLYNGQIELKDDKSFFNTENFKIYGGTLTANASNILKNFENNGIVNFISGTNNNWIKGTGTTIINGEVINSSTIENNVIINSGKKLTTNATNLEGQIENNGILNFTQGINNNEIIGIGNLLISGNITNNNNINQSSVTITGSLENNNDICSNKFILKQNGTVNNNGDITTDTLLIDENAEFNIGTSIENLTILENIENNGSLIFNGGTNNNVITGTGLTQVSNDVINQANITQNNLEILANKQLTNSTATITVNELLTINNNAKIINDGKLIISGGTNNGTIEQAINTSTTTINGNFVNNGTIEQTIFNVEENGKIQNNNIITATTITNNGNIETNATNINGAITNNKNLKFTNGTNNNLITGTGILLITGNVINNNTINQSSITVLGNLNNKNCIQTKDFIITETGIINNTEGDITTDTLLIDENAEFNIGTSIENLTILENIENNGSLIFNSGESTILLNGTGKLSILGNVINSNIVNQSTITISNVGKLINNNKIQTYDYINNGTTVNNSSITVNDEYYNVGITTNTNYIQAKIYTNRENSITDNFGKIQVNTLNIEENSIFNTENGELIILDGIENNGEFILNDGLNENYIYGLGTTIINGEVINSSTIVNNVIINANKQLTTNANNITGNINNLGNYILKADTNNNYIYGIGTTTIDGEVINSSTIVNNVIINANKQLTTKVDGITGDIENNGSFVFNNNGTNTNWIKGTGTTIIDGSVINSSTIVNAIIINTNKQLTTNATNITGNIENNGSLIFNGGTNNNVITGTGLTQVSNDVINQANITQNNLEILANKQLTNSTATITVNELLTINNNAKIINDGKLIISGGTNNGTIEQAINTSTTVINGNFVNNGTIKQNKLNIESTGKLTTNANNVETTNDLITNSGILEYTNGTNENKIEGLGHLLISGNVINNNTINQSSITIAGTLNNNNKINAKLKILGQMTTSANNINGNIENNGRLIFDSGINNNTITGTGTIEISSNIVNNSTINQDTIKINNELINNSQIIAKNIYITGQFKLGQTGNFYNATNSTLYNGAQIDLQNNKIQQHNFGNLTINSGIVNLRIDVDLKEKTIDTISATKFTGNGKINVKNINIIEDAKVSENILLSFADNNLKNKVETDITTAYTSLYKYSVDYDNSTGNFNFFRFSDDIIDNPIAFENTVSNQIGAYITQVNVIEQALTNIDSQINVIRHSKNNRNLYASNSNVIFKEKNSIEQGLWLRPYAVSETITVDDTDIKNDAYGTVGGLDLQISNSILASFYIGYTTSKQSYEEININQSGYLLGLTGSYITENYYLALTANAIFNKADAQNMFGTDNIENNSYTLAGKTGIDVKLGSKLTLQPNLLLMYSMINTADYVNSQNKKITSDTATNLHVEPSLKLMLNLENQFTPYAIVSMAFNSNSSKVMMEDIVLPEKEIGSYSDLGIGFEKNWNSWNLYLQGTGRFGARQGFGVFGGLKYKFGKANDKISKQLKEKINNKKSADDFETMQLEKQLEKEQKELEEMEKEND